MTMCPPEPPECPGNPQPYLRLTCGLAPGQCRAQVIMIGLQPLEPALLVWPLERQRPVLRELQIVIRVPSMQCLYLAMLSQPLQRILADRLQHCKARLTVQPRLPPQQALVDQRGKPIENCRL